MPRIVEVEVPPELAGKVIDVYPKPKWQYWLMVAAGVISLLKLVYDAISRR